MVRTRAHLIHLRPCPMGRARLATAWVHPITEGMRGALTATLPLRRFPRPTASPLLHRWLGPKTDLPASTRTDGANSRGREPRPYADLWSPTCSSRPVFLKLFTLYQLSLNVCWFWFAALHWHGLHFIGLRIHRRAVPLTHVFSQHIT